MSDLSSGRLGYGRLGYFRLGAIEPEGGTTSYFTADARLGHWDTFTVDAVISKTFPSSTNVDAAVKGNILGSLTADAFFAGRFRIDAWVVLSPTLYPEGNEFGGADASAVTDRNIDLGTWSEGDLFVVIFSSPHSDAITFSHSPGGFTVLYSANYWGSTTRQAAAYRVMQAGDSSTLAVNTGGTARQCSWSVIRFVKGSWGSLSVPEAVVTGNANATDPAAITPSWYLTAKSLVIVGGTTGTDSYSSGYTNYGVHQTGSSPKTRSIWKQVQLGNSENPGAWGGSGTWNVFGTIAVRGPNGAHWEFSRVTADAVKQKTYTPTGFAVSADIKGTQTGSFLIGDGDPTFDGGAWVKVPDFVGGFSADAVIFDTRWFPSTEPGSFYPFATESGGYDGSDKSSRDISLTFDPGDLLIVSVVSNKTQSGWTHSPGGFSALSNTTYGDTTTVVGWRRMQGGDSTTLTVSTSSSGRCAWSVLRIPTGFWSGSPETSSVAGAIGEPNPPSLTPSWGAGDNLYLTWIGAGSAIEGLPSGYTGFTVRNTGTKGTQWAFRKATTSPEDPGSWATGIGYNLSATLAVRSYIPPLAGSPFTLNAVRLRTRSGVTDGKTWTADAVITHGAEFLITNAPTEVLVSPVPEARATSVAAEALVVPYPNARVTGVPTEVLVLGYPNARATSVPVEALVLGSPNARATGVAVETLIATPHSFKANASIYGTVERDFDLEAELIGPHFFLYAVISLPSLTEFTADALKRINVPVPDALTIDATFHPRFLANAVKTKTWTVTEGPFVLSALKSLPASTQTFAANAFINGRIRAYAAILKNTVWLDKWPLDAEILPRRWQSNAVINRSGSGTKTVDAILSTHPTGTLTADATIYAPDALGLYADIIGQREGSFSVDILTWWPFFHAEWMTAHTVYSDKTDANETPTGNVLVTHGQAETLLPGCGLDVYRSTKVNLSWNIWVSQNKDDPSADPNKQVRIRLRRTHLAGAILYEVTLPVQSGNYIDGHRQQETNTFVDSSPTDGLYVLTVQQVQGNENTEIWSDTRTFAASGVFMHADAYFDGWHGAHVTSHTVEALVTRPAVARVTQSVVEALVRKTDVPSRVTQNAVEVLVGPGTALPDVRVSQRTVEVLGPRWLLRFWANALIAESKEGTYSARSLVLSHASSDATIDAVIVPRHFHGDAVQAVLILDSPETKTGDFYGLPYLYTGIIEYDFVVSAGGSDVVRWHGGTVSTMAVGDHWEARVSDSYGNGWAIVPFYPAVGETWHARFVVDAGLHRSVFAKVWRDDEPGWMVEATAPASPPQAFAYATATSISGLKEWTYVAPWRFDNVFTIDSGIRGWGSFTADADFYGTPSKSTTANAAKRRTYTTTKTVDAVVVPVYPTFTIDSAVRWHIPPDSYKWSRFWVDARIDRGFWVDAWLHTAFVADAVVGPAPEDPTFLLEGLIHRPVGPDMPGRIPWGYLVGIHPTGSFTAKAWKEPTGIPPTYPAFYLYAYISTGRKFTVDARLCVLTYPEGSFAADAETSQTYRTTVALADAVIHKPGGWHLWCDAFLKAEAPPPTLFPEASFAADASVAGGFFLDSIFVRNLFTVDAQFAGERRGEVYVASYIVTPGFWRRLTADAVLYRPYSSIEPLWMSGYILSSATSSFSVDAETGRGFAADASVIAPRSGSTTIGAFVLSGPAKWFPPGGGSPVGPGTDPKTSKALPGGWQGLWGRTINITVGGGDITGNVVWTETSFTSRSKTGSGNFYITLRGGANYAYGSEVYLDIDGRRTFGGLLTRTTYAYFQPEVKDDAQVKTVLEGVDFNYVLDRLIVHNPNLGPDGGYVPIDAFDIGTTDAEVITEVFNKYLTNKPEWLHIGGINASNVVAEDTAYKLQDPLQTFRSLLFELSRKTACIFWVGPFGDLWYGDRASFTAPYSLSKGGGAGVGVRALSVTSDVSNSLRMAIVWGDIEDPAKAANRKTDFGKIVYRKNDSGTSLIPWQYGEYDAATIHTTSHVNKRADAIIDRMGKVVWTARGRSLEPGFMAGQNIDVEGVPENLIVKELTVGFYTGEPVSGGGYRGIPYYDLTLGLQPDDPWSYYDALTFNEKTDSTPGGSRSGRPQYQVAIPYWWGRGARYALPCAIKGVELPISHFETFTSEGPAWGSLEASDMTPKHVWRDEQLDHLSVASILNLSYAKASIEGGVGYLDNLFDWVLGPDGARLRLGPAWQMGLFPSCQVWVIGSNPDGRLFSVESYGARVQWEGTTLSISVKYPNPNSLDILTYDMGGPPEPCYVRLYVGGNGAAASVWRFGQDEPRNWLVQASHVHPWLDEPYVLADLGLLLGYMYWMPFPQDGTAIPNDASIIRVMPPVVGDSEPIGVTSMVIEQGAGELDLAAVPVTDITVQPQRTEIRYAIDRPTEYCWGSAWGASGYIPATPLGVGPGVQVWDDLWHQDYSVRAYTVGKANRSWEYNLFYWWYVLRDYYGIPSNAGAGNNGWYNGEVVYAGGEPDGWFDIRLYDPYLRSSGGWFPWWSPCIFGGYYGPGAGDRYGWGPGQWNQTGPYPFWDDSTFPVLCLPSKYIRGFLLRFKMASRTYQDFSIILGIPDGNTPGYQVGLWALTTDKNNLDDEDVDASGYPKDRKRIGTFYVQGQRDDWLEFEVDFDPDPDKRKPYFMYGLEWVGDTIGQTDDYGPHGGPLFGPPWVRHLVAPTDRQIIMRWDAVVPEKAANGQSLKPETTVLYGAPIDTEAGHSAGSGGGMAGGVFNPHHGWVDEVVPVKSVTTSKTVFKGYEQSERYGIPYWKPVYETTERKRRLFRLSRAATPGTISVFANGKRLIYGWGDPDEWNKTHPDPEDKMLCDFWLLDGEEKGDWSDAAVKDKEGNETSPSEPRTYALRKGIAASAVNARYLIVEYQQARGDQQHRQREETAINADRLTRGQIHGR